MVLTEVGAREHVQPHHANTKGRLVVVQRLPLIRCERAVESGAIRVGHLRDAVRVYVSKMRGLGAVLETGVTYTMMPP